MRCPTPYRRVRVDRQHLDGVLRLREELRSGDEIRTQPDSHACFECAYNKIKTTSGSGDDERIR